MRDEASPKRSYQPTRIILTEYDVPGATLPIRPVYLNRNTVLRRWLKCRGLPLKGKKADLIERQVCDEVLNYKN